MTRSWSSSEDRIARQIAETPRRRASATPSWPQRRGRRTLEDLFKALEEGETETLNLILKGDVSGSVEALEDALLKIDVGDEVDLRVIHRGVGAITQNDVNLAVGVERHHHRLQRAARRARRRARRPRGRRRPLLLGHLRRRSTRSRRPSRACSSRSTRRSQLGTAEVREVFRSTQVRQHRRLPRPLGRRSAATPRPGSSATASVVADNLTIDSLQAVQGRRDRGPRGLRVRYRPRVVQRHQGR